MGYNYWDIDYWFLHWCWLISLLRRKDGNRWDIQISINISQHPKAKRHLDNITISYDTTLHTQWPKCQHNAHHFQIPAISIIYCNLPFGCSYCAAGKYPAVSNPLPLRLTWSNKHDVAIKLWYKSLCPIYDHGIWNNRRGCNRCSSSRSVIGIIILLLRLLSLIPSWLSWWLWGRSELCSSI